jgi:hypothetical protein
VADAHTNTSADLHSVPDVYPVAYTNSYALPDTESRSYIHTVPDLYTLAYIDTDACTYGYSDTDTYADCDCANTDAGADSHGSTDTDADCDCANADPGADGHTCTHADTHSHTYAYAGASPHFGTNGYAFADHQCAVSHHNGYGF